MNADDADWRARDMTDSNAKSDPVPDRDTCRCLNLALRTRMCRSKYRSKFVRKYRQKYRRLRTRLYRQLRLSLYFDLNLDLNLHLHQSLLGVFLAKSFKMLLRKTLALLFGSMFESMLA